MSIWECDLHERLDNMNFRGNAHVIEAFNKNFGIINNQKWTLALSIFYVGYCEALFFDFTFGLRHWARSSRNAGQWYNSVRSVIWILH